MSVLDRATLEESTLADLHAIASELSIDGYRRLRKGDLIDTIIAHQGGEEPPAELSERRRAPPSSAERRRGRMSRTPRTSECRPTAPRAARRGAAAGWPGANGSARRAAAAVAVVVVRRADRRLRGAKRGASPRTRAKEEPEIVEGTVELLPNGSGFVRVSPPEPSDRRRLHLRRPGQALRARQRRPRHRPAPCRRIVPSASRRWCGSTRSTAARPRSWRIADASTICRPSSRASASSSAPTTRR